MRIVGVTGANLLNLYYVSLNAGVSGGVAAKETDGKGNVTLSADPAKATFINEPLKSLVSSAALTNDIYFVPAYDFEGIKVNGSEVTVTSVVADDNTLYKLSSGSTITKISL